MTNYEPLKLKSGKYEGQSVERLMFTNYNYLVYLYKKMGEGSSENPNRLEKRIKELLKKGENRKSVLLCPQCGEKHVQYFSVRYSRAGGASIGAAYTSCDTRECMKVLSSTTNAPVSLFPIKFSALQYVRKSERKMVEGLFRNVFGMKTLTEKKLTEFFRE